MASFLVGRDQRAHGECVVDTHRVGTTMAACSPSLIRSFELSGPPPPAYRSRSAASSLSGWSRACSCTAAFTDADLDDAVRAALTELIQSAA